MKQFGEAGAKVLGLSVDSTFALKSWATAMGGIRHPLLSDFWPHGSLAQSLGIFNEDAGIVMRTMFIIDPEGVVRHSETHTSTLPDPDDAIALLSALQS